MGQQELDEEGPDRKEPRVFTVDETARILRLGRGSTYRAIASGEIPSLRVGERILVPAAALDKLLAGESDT
jgi:excisionase family DNA binding protein